MNRSVIRNSRPRLRAALLASAAFAAASSLGSFNAARANPMGPNGSDGGITYNGLGTSDLTVTLDKSRTIIDWTSFNINAGETTQFIFGSYNWIVINRLTAGSANINGNLFGCLNAACSSYGGNIWILAADGVIFGHNAVVNTGGLLATTSMMSTSDSAFLNGTENPALQFAFAAANSGTSVQVQSGAQINGFGGTLAFIAPQVTTQAGSTVSTVAGKSGVLYGAADSYTIQFTDDGTNFDLLSFDVPAGSVGGTDSSAPITLAGNTSAGNVYIAAVTKASVANAIIDATGTISATSASSDGGDIVLSAGGGISNGMAAAPSGGAGGTVSAILNGKLQADTQVALNTTGSLDAHAATITGSTNNSATTLTGSSTGGANMSNSANRISNVAGFTNTGSGNVAISSSTSLTASGIDSGAGNLTLKTSGAGSNLTLNGNLTAGSANGSQVVTLISSGNIKQTGGTISAGHVTGSSSGSTSLNGANLVGELDAFKAASGFSFTDAQALNVAGSDVDGLGFSGINAGGGNLSLTTTGSGSDLTLASNLSAGPTNGSQIVTLESSSNINQTAGIITAGRLTGSSAGSTAINGANHLGELDAFQAGSGFSLSNAHSLNVVGADVDGLGFSGINSGTGNLSLATTGAGSNLSLLGALNAGAANGTQIVSLISSGNISQTSGIISAGHVTGSSSGSTSLTDANLVGELDAFNAGSGFSFADAHTLNVAGSDVDSLGFSGINSGTGNLTLATTGAGSDLILASNLTAGTASGSQILTLVSSGNIDQTSGAITGGRLTGSSAGYTSLGTIAAPISNIVGELDAFEAGGDFSLTDATALTVKGANDGLGFTGVTAGESNTTGNLTLDVTNGNLLLQTANANLTAASSGGSQVVTLLAGNGSISQSGGIITANTLTGSSFGSTSLNDANLVGTLSGFTAGTGLSLVNAQALTASNDEAGGALSLISNGTLSASGLSGGTTVGLEATSGDLLLNGNITAGTTATLVSDAGNIAQNSGTITANTLTGSSFGSTSLNDANLVGTLSGFDAGGGLSLVNAQALTASNDTAGGALSLTSNGTLSASGLSGGTTVGLEATSDDLLLNGNITAGTTATLISDAGNVTQNGGVLKAATATGSSFGSTSLNDANLVGTLSGFNTGGGLSLVNAKALTASNDSAGGALSLISNGTLSASGLSGGTTVGLEATSGNLLLNGNITSGTTATLISDVGNISQNGGVLKAATVTGSSKLSTSLNDANLVGTLSGFDAGTGLSLVNAQALTASNDSAGGALSLTSNGTLSASGLSGGTTIGLEATSGDLLLSGNITAGTTATLISDAGNVTQSGGVINAAKLTGSSKLSTSLNDANLVGTLSGFDAGTGLSLVNAQALTASNDSAGGALSLTSNGTLSASGLSGGTTVGLEATSGNLLLNGNITAGTTATLISDAGNVTQNGGVLKAATLTGSSFGSTSLNDANLVGTLSGFDAGTGLSLVNAQALTASNDSAGGALSLTSNGTLTASGLSGGTTVGLEATSGDLLLNGNITAGTTATLIADNGNITQNGGVINAAKLTGSSKLSTSLNDANLVGTVSGFNAGGGLSLVNAKALTASNDSAGGALSLTSNGTLAASGLSGGTTVGLEATSGNLLLNGNITAGTTATLVSDAGNITQNSGTITANTLTGSSFGSTSLNDANLVGTLSGFDAGGGLSLVNAQALTASNDSADGALSLTSNGTLVASGLSGGTTVGLEATSGDLLLNGDITAGTTATLISDAGNISQSGGIVTANMLTGSSFGSTSLNDANLVGTLSGFDAASGLSLVNAQALTASNDTAGGALSLTSNGTLAASGLSGGTTVGLEATSGDLLLNGNITAGTTATLISDAGNITQNGGIINANALTGLSSGSTSLNDANLVGELDAFMAGSGFSLTDAHALNVAGTVQSAHDDIDIKTTGTGNNLTLTGVVTANGGGVEMSATGSGSDLILNGNVAADTTATFNAAEDILTNGGAITATTIDMTAGSNITQSAGIVDGTNSVTLSAGTGNIIENGGEIKTDSTTGAVTMTAGHDILIGEKAFTDEAPNQPLASLGQWALNFQASNQVANHTFIKTGSLSLTAGDIIVSENTGSGPSSPLGFHPEGIDITNTTSPAITITANTANGGKLVAVDLFVLLNENGMPIDPNAVADESQIVFGPKTVKNNNYEINGCVIHSVNSCTISNFTIKPMDPNKQAELVLLPASDQEEDELDLTISGAGNDEIWQEDQ